MYIVIKEVLFGNKNKISTVQNNYLLQQNYIYFGIFSTQLVYYTTIL